MAAGLLANRWLTPALAAAAADWAGTAADLFLRAIRMIVAPLVFATLAGGIASLRGGRGTGRLALLALAWFAAASLVSLGLGLLAADLLRPGLDLASGHVVPAATAPPGFAAPDVQAILLRLVPTSVVDALARNDIVQIVVFASLFGIANGRMGGPAAVRMGVALSDLAGAMLALTGLVMRAAPLAVFASLFASLARGGLDLARGYAGFLGGFYATMLVLWALLAGAGWLVLRGRTGPLLRAVAPAMLLGFATASSEAVFPQLVALLERFGVPPRRAGFVLPLGYAFNLDGSMLFQAFAALAVAQACGVALALPAQVELLGLLMLASKGTAGVPRAAMLSLAAVLPGFGVPERGLLLILGIDHLLDMGRTATSVLGNAVATAALSGNTGRRPVGDPPIAAPGRGNPS